MKKILCEPSGRVAQIVSPGSEFPVHGGLTWRDGPDDVSEAHTWNGAAFVAPAPAPAPTLAQRLAATEGAGTVARKVEEILDHLVNGAAISPAAAAWLANRKAERAK